MRSFDCMAKECPLFGPHLLEASAGTGKTFAIEHVFTRLLLESENPPIEIEQILVMTFTRAAARELKERIRSNLEKALSLAQTPGAIRRLREATAGFDRYQIFTIHGFCHRMLEEYTFDGNAKPSVGEKIPRKLVRAACQFLEGELDLCLEQVSLLLRDFDSLEELARSLLRMGRLQGEPLPFSLSLRRFSEALQGWGERIDEEKLLADFYALARGYKAMKGDFPSQVAALSRAFTSPKLSFRTLIKERGSLFSFLAPANRKVRSAPEETLYYPGFFAWATSLIAPFIKEATCRKKLLHTLAAEWRKRVEETPSLRREWCDHDEILTRMDKALGNALFLQNVQKRYVAAIVDEFQDTDPLQWKIFQRLFLEREPPLRALYLVGDPKQSIYRFRSADVYTYFEARELLGEKALYSLDANYRSSKELIGTLNALFNRDWFYLPRLKKHIPYTPVCAMASANSSLGDQKGAVHAFFARGEKELFERYFLPAVVQEIEQLRSSVKTHSSFALLVKDRYQAETALAALQARGIPAWAKSHIPLGKTDAFRALCELFEALAFPHDAARARLVQAGPFAGRKLPSLEGGLIPFFRELQMESADGKQIIEELLDWEKEEGFSIEGLLRFLKEFEKLDAEEGGRRHLEVDSDAVQILTTHISKGLEFDIVFALGLAAAPPEEEEGQEEADAEKLRQLYVAMTRAKRRLYLFVPLSSKGKSPIELFLGASPLFQIERLSQEHSLSFEELSHPLGLTPLSSPLVEERPLNLVCALPFLPSFLHSFTSLASKEKRKTLSQNTSQTVPKGVETGIAVHAIFERLFVSPTPLWRDPPSIDAIVAEELNLSSLAPWTKAIQEIVQSALLVPLIGHFALKDLEPGQFQTETEFCFSTPPHFVKGFIDLIFCVEGKYYLLDWKMNCLEAYHLAALKEAMDCNDYWLQAALYAEALRRQLARPLERAVYFFLRGAAPLIFQPDITLLERCNANA